jgi:DNA repair protein RecO (recombination protein O)
MLVKSKGIIFNRIKFSESSQIVKVFTLEHGLLSFIFKGINSTKAKIKPAHLTPLNVVEINFYMHPNKNLKTVKELVCNPVFHQIHLHENKRALGALMLELLNRSIREEEPNPKLFNLILNSIIELEQEIETNLWFPHRFLISLGSALGNGIQASSYFSESIFDLTEGDFLIKPESQNYTNKELTFQLYGLVQNGSADVGFRKDLLTVLLTFARIHYAGNAPIKSIEVFKQTGVSRR